MANSLFVTGTGTEVGKTFIAASIIRIMVAAGKRVGIYKPALSGYTTDLRALTITEGFESQDDDFLLWDAAGRPGSLYDVAPQRFRAPLAPHLAARAEGMEIDPDLFRSGLRKWQAVSNHVVVEGAGGLFSPISDRELNADLAAELGFPLVIVAPNVLGVLHATLSTLYAARSYRGGLPVTAIILNDLPMTPPSPSSASNYDELTRLCDPTPVIRHTELEKYFG